MTYKTAEMFVFCYYNESVPVNNVWFGKKKKKLHFGNWQTLIEITSSGKYQTVYVIVFAKQNTPKYKVHQ